MQDSGLQQKIAERINVLFMRLFDPDNTYARFGIFDGTGKAIMLSRKLGLMLSSQGSSAARLHKRQHRATNLVRTLLEPGDGQTRAGGGALPGVGARPPEDEARRVLLFQAAVDRLGLG